MNLLTDFDQEQYDRIRRREGFEEGTKQKAEEAAINFLKEGDPPEKSSSKSVKRNSTPSHNIHTTLR